MRRHAIVLSADVKMQTYKCVNVQVQMRQCADVPVCRCAIVQRADVQMSRCANVKTFTVCNCVCEGRSGRSQDRESTYAVQVPNR